MKTFELPGDTSDSWRRIGRTMLAIGIFLCLEAGAFASVGLFTGIWKLETVDFGVAIWFPGSAGVFCIIASQLRKLENPVLIAEEPARLTLTWADGTVRVIPWGASGRTLVLLDSSRLPIARALTNRTGWYRIKMPLSPAAYHLSEEAFYGILQIAHNSGCRVERVTANPQLHWFCERVVIRGPKPVR
jgi:hypothetical protein